VTARYPTKRATSAGGLVYTDRPDGRWVVLIAHRDTSGRLQWTLPKGGLEADEDLETAAVREVLEETGLRAEIIQKLGVVDYWFVWKPDQVRYHKYVHYYLMAHQGGDLRHRDDEAEDVRWLPIAEAVTRLSHANERRLVLAAHPELAEEPGPGEAAAGAAPESASLGGDSGS
jgi:ADP-ribose pyrophosphatase YjhB (NUDIX family)